MFSPSTYRKRREQLARALETGVALFLGNLDSPMNYEDNMYPFRQDSSFLYYWGLDSPGLAALVDADEGRHMLIGDDATVADMVWTGPQPRLRERAAAVDVQETMPAAGLEAAIRRFQAQGRKVHVLPQYRTENRVRLESLLRLPAGSASDKESSSLVRAVIAQRSVKDNAEVAEIEDALKVSHAMHTAAMREAVPGRFEREIAGMVEGIAIAGGGRLAFPIIFSKRGEVLHNHTYDNLLQEGDLVVHDSGASARSGYASDITRTIPVSGKFSERQRTIYECVLSAQMEAIDGIRPGQAFRDLHFRSAITIARALSDLGLMKGDPQDAVSEGAHALFYPHGLGHMMGLDVHDMEGLGEDLVGYDADVQRSTQFGTRSLRLGKSLEPGHVVTVEPGCYFIEALIEQWAAEKRCAAFINYSALEAWHGFGGVRIEDDVLVTAEGCRVLGRAIPKSVQDVEAACVR